MDLISRETSMIHKILAMPVTTKPQLCAVHLSMQQQNLLSYKLVQLLISYSGTGARQTLSLAFLNSLMEFYSKLFAKHMSLS